MSRTSDYCPLDLGFNWVWDFWYECQWIFEKYVFKKNCYFYCQWYTCKDVTSLNNTQFCAHLREFSKRYGGPLLQALPCTICKYNNISRWKSAMTFNNFTIFFLHSYIPYSDKGKHLFSLWNFQACDIPLSACYTVLFIFFVSNAL